MENTDPAAIRSIVRLGATAPAVTGEKVSAIPAPGNAGHRRPGRSLPVMVMRGGIVGDAFAAATPVPPAPAVTEASAQPSATPAPVQADMQQIKDRVQGWLQNEAKRIFGERLVVYAEKLGVTYSIYALSSAATRWGSCSSDGKIRLNWRLIHFPMSIIDYVVAHELSHLREMNHSPAFWQTVESIFPEFREARHTLKHHPPELLPSL